VTDVSIKAGGRALVGVMPQSWGPAD